MGLLLDCHLSTRSKHRRRNLRPRVYPPNHASTVDPHVAAAHTVTPIGDRIELHGCGSTWSRRTHLPGHLRAVRLRRSPGSGAPGRRTLPPIFPQSPHHRMPSPVTKVAARTQVGTDRRPRRPAACAQVLNYHVARWLDQTRDVLDQRIEWRTAQALR